MKDSLLLSLRDWLETLGLNESGANTFSVIIIVLSIIIISWLSDFITKQILLTVLRRIIRRTKTAWDDALLEQRVFHKIAHIVPAIVVYSTIEYAFPNSIVLVNIITKLASIYIVFVIVQSINALLNGVNLIYSRTTGEKKGTSIKSYIQVLKIAFYVIAAIIALSLLLNKNVGYFLTGMGAMAAVLLLIFQDTILGLVAGVQISGNDMLRIGDWISMPARNADGVVTDISLHTVKVQNWDKTIATIPTYALVKESYNNWRGMEESGVRRICRSLHLDMNSVHFCTSEELKKFSKIHRIKDYIANKEQELKEFNEKNNIDGSVVVNGRRQTNLGVFRKYLEFYLRNNPNISEDMTLMVRQLEPTETGIPMQIYVFSKVQAWVDYEGIQSDIFDHILSVVPEFNLRVFQNPTGADFSKLNN